MTIRLETPPDSAAAGFGNRAAPGARQARWMQELERAAFGARKAPAPVRAQASAAPAASAAAQVRASSMLDDAAHHATRVLAQPLQDTCMVAPAPDDAPPLARGFSPAMPLQAPALTTATRPGAAAASTPEAPALAMLQLRQRAGMLPAAPSPPAPDPRAPQRGAAAPLAAPYAAAHLQLFANASDATIEAFLRDAALAPGQARAIAGAMAEALATQGKRLAGLTVNGKAVTLPGTPQQTTGTAAPRPSTTWYRTGDLA